MHVLTMDLYRCTPSPLRLRVQARSRGGKWCWTLKRAQERSRAGRWSWAQKVGLVTAVLRTVGLPRTAVETATAEYTSCFAVARHCFNVVVLAVVHRLLGLLRVGLRGRATHSPLPSTPLHPPPPPPPRP